MSTAKAIKGLLASLVLLIGANLVLAQDWPQWRGPDRDNHVVNFTAPKAWPKEMTKKWTATVGDGVSSPVLAGGKVYAFGRQGGDEVTTCLDAETGKELWKDKYATGAVTGAASGFAGTRSTPAVADGKVCTLGVNGVVSCLDANTGKVVWRKTTGEKPQFYTSASPLIAEGKCIVFLSALTAYDLADGSVKWKGPTGTPYGSPSLMTVEGVKQIVTPTTSAVVGVKLADGKQLWQFKLPGGGYQVTYGTPIIDGQTVIYCAPGGKKGGGSTMAYKVEKKGDTFAATELWKANVSPYMYNTPVLRDGLLFGLSSGKTFFCMDAKTGKELWKDTTNRGEVGGILNADSVILAVTGTSDFVAFEPSAKGYKEVAKYKVSQTPGYASSIVAGNRVYVKGSNAVTMWTLN